ncbi:MAG: hypothetical protein ABIQ66_02010 [Novosphingobium sp.]
MNVGVWELLELVCPVCGALIEADNMGVMIELAREHTLDAHDYNIPDAHVIDAVRSGTNDH